MNNQKYVITFLAFIISACSNQSVYDNLLNSRLQECNQIIEETLREECLSKNQMSYKEYQQNRRTLLNNGN